MKLSDFVSLTQVTMALLQQYQMHHKMSPWAQIQYVHCVQVCMVSLDIQPISLCYTLATSDLTQFLHVTL